MTIGSRIIKRREALGLERGDLSRLTKIPYSTLAGIENDRQSGTSRVGVIADVLRCRARWLEDGSGPIELDKGDNVAPAANPGRLAPVISWVQAGNWSDIVDNFQPGDAEEWLPAPRKAGPRAYFLEVEGESMYNPAGRWSYRPGEKICVDPDHAAENMDRVIVRLEDRQKTTFKQLVMEDGKMWLKALNPDWPERIIEVNENATICGVVIGKWVDE